MTRTHFLLVSFFAALFALSKTAGSVAIAEGEGTPSSPVRVGLVSSLFRDVPESLGVAMMQPLGALMKSQTGMTGEMISGGDAIKLGDMLAANQVQLGVFHGVEFAWARQKYPELQPLMIAINQQPFLNAQIVVRNDCPVDDLNLLKGKTVAIAKGTREHCRLFLNRHCRECGAPADAFFTKITNPANVEDALDDVIDKLVHVTVVDGFSLECFQRRKPGRFNKLKIIKQSENFPAGVVAYRPGTLSEDALQRFRSGMMSANQNPFGKQMMTLWKLTSFEPVPSNYDSMLVSILKSYPPPAAGVATDK